MPGVGPRVFVTDYILWSRDADQSTGNYNGISAGNPQIRFTVEKHRDHWRLVSHDLGGDNICRSRAQAFEIADQRATEAKQPRIPRRL